MKPGCDITIPLALLKQIREVLSGFYWFTGDAEAKKMIVEIDKILKDK